MRVTEKGQVTIPKDIRDHLGISAGTEVLFIPARDGALLVRANADRAEVDGDHFRAWAEQVEGMLDIGDMSTGDFMTWIRGERDDVDAH